MNHPTIKYRPSFTLDEIQTILSFIPPSCGEIRRKLEVFTLKAQHGITKPSHVALGTQSMAQSLGFSATPAADMTTLVDLYRHNRSILSPVQLTKVLEHMYLNDLLSPEEQSLYEQSLMQGS